MTAQEVREKLSSAEICEWAVYLTSPFSMRSREALLNGWLVHTIRSIVASKKKVPKFADSLFPFDKVAGRFFLKRKPSAVVKPDTERKRGAWTRGETEHMAQVIRLNYERAMNEYKAGKRPNRFGLFYREKAAD